MTGPCPGAQTGVAKPGFAALQYISPGAIGGALASLAGWEGAAVGAAIGALTYELTTFCPGGPPAPPTFTVGDITALLGGPAQSGYNAAVVKMRDFLGGVFWPLLCDCSAGGTPTISPPSTYPTGAPQTHNVFAPTTPCFTFSNVNHSVVGFPSQQQYAQFTPASGQVPTLFTGQVTAVAGTGYFYQVGFTIEDGAGTTEHKLSGLFTSSQLANVTIPVPSGYIKNIWATIYHDSGTQSGGSSITMSGQFYCNGTNPGAQSPCCPPDPATQNALDELLRMVTLIQRQLVPFGYILGTTHAGLTGAGTIDISGLLGAKIDPTTIPGSYGRQGTTPEEFFELGWVTFGSPDGYPSSYRVEHDPQLLLPARCSAYTTLAYDLAPGVELTITEVSREP